MGSTGSSVEMGDSGVQLSSMGSVDLSSGESISVGSTAVTVGASRSIEAGAETIGVSGGAIGIEAFSAAVTTSLMSVS
eukprot:COSAG05_NODE_24000_length_254_cov_0.980645_1_plen_77_part_10